MARSEQFLEFNGLCRLGRALDAFPDPNMFPLGTTTVAPKTDEGNKKATRSDSFRTIFIFPPEISVAIERRGRIAWHSLNRAFMY